MHNAFMSSTYSSLNYHLVFGTKSRTPFIEPGWSEDLHGYLGGTIAGLDGVCIAVNGIEDHVHMLLGLRTTHCVADFVRELKKSSTKWVKTDLGRKRFAWQEGYGIFTASWSAVPPIKKYIANQREHHRQFTFREEFLALCKKEGVKVNMEFFD